MSDFLPEDVLTKIFLYLPTKSIVCVTCVCKSWYSLITSSDFITTHLNQTRDSNKVNNTHHIFLQYYPGHPEKERHALHIDNDSFDRYDDIEFPFQSVEKYFRILGSCNGLICLSDDLTFLNNTIILWNPTIRKSLTLPRPDFTYLTHGPYDHAIGFGFDSQTNDYKVVRIVYLGSEEDHLPRVQIYKLSTRSWVTISTNVDSSSFIGFGRRFSVQSFINSAVHWPAYKKNIGDLIMSFNVIDEVFREIRLPAGYKNYSFMHEISLTLCGEWLSFFDYRKNQFNELLCSIWVMKEYGVVDSWTKLYTLDLNGELGKPLCFRRNNELGKPLGFRRNGEILLTLKSRELVSYDPRNRKIKYLGIHDFDEESYCYRFSFHVDTYVESLVLVGDANRFRKPKACGAKVEGKEKQIDLLHI